MSTQPPDETTALGKRSASNRREQLTYTALGIPAVLLATAIIYFLNAWFDSIGWWPLPHPMTVSRAVLMACLVYAVLSLFKRYWLAALAFFILALPLASLASHLF